MLKSLLCIRQMHLSLTPTTKCGISQSLLMFCFFFSLLTHYTSFHSYKNTWKLEARKKNHFHFVPRVNDSPSFIISRVCWNLYFIKDVKCDFHWKWIMHTFKAFECFFIFTCSYSLFLLREKYIHEMMMEMIIMVDESEKAEKKKIVKR